MGRRWVVAAMLPLCACGASLGDGPSDATESNGSDGNQNMMGDASPDGRTMLGPWGTAAKIPGADTALDEDDVVLSANELELYFKKSNGTDQDLWVMTRTSTTAAFGPATQVTNLNSGQGEESPRLADNDLTIYFGRAGDIYKATRANVSTQNWTTPAPVAAFNTGANEKWAVVCGNGYAMVSRANGTNLQDLYEGNVNTSVNTLVAQLNTTSNEQGNFLTSDCLTLYFQSNRTNDQFDIYMSTRTTTSSAWSNPTAISDFNTATLNEEDGWLSPSQRTFAFASNATNNQKDLYISTR
jgi:hypothetical protein